MSAIRPLHILILDDNPVDADLLRDALAQAGIEFEAVHVEDEAGLLSNLSEKFDLILADYTLPQFNALQALQLLQASGLDIPFIVVTGSISEETAVACIKQGAADYLLKDRLVRLGQAVERALADKQLREEKRKAEQELAASEARYRRLFEAAKDGILILDASSGQVLDANPFLLDLLGYSPEDLLGKELWEIGLFKDIASSQESFRELQDKGYICYEDLPLETRDGRTIAVEFVSNVYLVNDEKVIQCNIRDITERKQTRKEIESLAKFPAENPNPVMRLRDDGLILFANEKGKALLAELGSAAGNFAPPVWRDLIADTATSPSGKSFDFQSGEKIWSIFVAPISDRAYINVYGSDITERKRGEKALRASEEQYRSLIESTDAVIATVDENGRFVFVNAIGAAYFGHTPADLIGKTLHDLFPEPTATRQLQTIQDVIQQGTGSISEMPIPVVGKTRWFRTSVQPIRDGTGRVTLAMINSVDLTERKQAEESLAQERNLLRTLIDALPDVIYAKDVEGQSTLRNSANARQVGAASADEMIGKTDFDYYPLALAEQYSADDQAVIQSGKPLMDREEPVITADGSQGWMLTTKVPLRDAQGNVVGLVGIGRDITGRKLAEEKLRKLNRALAVLSDVNEAIVRIRQISVLFENVCRIAVELGGFRMAWVGLVDSETKRLKPVAHAGAFEGYLEKLGVALSDNPHGPGPTASAMHTGRQVIVNDIEHDPRVAPWREDALKLGYRAVAAFPLKVADEVRGTFSLFADAPEFFDEEELELLDEMVADISFAMEFAEHEDKRQQAEMALKQYLQTVDEMRVFLQTTLDAFPTNTVVLDADGTIINVNASWIRFADENSAPSPMHYLGANYLTVCDTAAGAWSEEAAPAADGIRAVIAGRQDAYFLEYPCHSSTEKRWFLMGVTPFPETAPRRVVIVHINITERKQAEDELQNAHDVLEQRVANRTAELSQAKERIEAIFNSTKDAIVVAGPDSLIAQKNPSFRSLFGYQPGEAVGQPLTALFAPDYVEIVTEALRHATADAQPTEVEIVARRNDGTLFDADTTISPIVGQDKMASGVVCSVHDVTVRNEIERDLQALNQLKTDFLSTAAHELRTPLTSIRGFSEILLTRQLDTDRQKRYTTLINEQATQLGKLIDDLLDISRLEAKRSLSLNMEPINLAELINEVVVPFREFTANHNIQVEVLRDCPTLIGDPIRLSEVMKNLLSNAIKYSPKGGTVTVSVRQMPGELQISVQDDGLGMTAEQLSHLFEKFYRAHASIASIPGTGLGLTICKLIVELHGGKIWVESQLEVGTTIYFTLPLPDDAK